MPTQAALERAAQRLEAESLKPPARPPLSPTDVIHPDMETVSTESADLFDSYTKLGIPQLGNPDVRMTLRIRAQNSPLTKEVLAEMPVFQDFLKQGGNPEYLSRLAKLAMQAPLDPNLDEILREQDIKSKVSGGENPLTMEQRAKLSILDPQGDNQKSAMSFLAKIFPPEGVGVGTNPASGKAEVFFGVNDPDTGELRRYWVDEDNFTLKDIMDTVGGNIQLLSGTLGSLFLKPLGALSRVMGVGLFEAFGETVRQLAANAIAPEIQQEADMGKILAAGASGATGESLGMAAGALAQKALAPSRPLIGGPPTLNPAKQEAQHFLEKNFVPATMSQRIGRMFTGEPPVPYATAPRLTFDEISTSRGGMRFLGEVLNETFFARAAHMGAKFDAHKALTEAPQEFVRRSFKDVSVPEFADTLARVVLESDAEFRLIGGKLLNAALNPVAGKIMRAEPIIQEVGAVRDFLKSKILSDPGTIRKVFQVITNNIETKPGPGTDALLDFLNATVPVPNQNINADLIIDTLISKIKEIPVTSALDIESGLKGILRSLGSNPQKRKEAAAITRIMEVFKTETEAAFPSPAAYARYVDANAFWAQGAEIFNDGVIAHAMRKFVDVIKKDPTSWQVVVNDSYKFANVLINVKSPERAREILEILNRAPAIAQHTPINVPLNKGKLLEDLRGAYLAHALGANTKEGVPNGFGLLAFFSKSGEAPAHGINPLITRGDAASVILGESLRQEMLLRARNLIAIQKGPGGEDLQNKSFGVLLRFVQLGTFASSIAAAGAMSFGGMGTGGFGAIASPGLTITVGTAVLLTPKLLGWIMRTPAGRGWIEKGMTIPAGGLDAIRFMTRFTTWMNQQGLPFETLSPQQQVEIFMNERNEKLTPLPKGFESLEGVPRQLPGKLKGPRPPISSSF